MSLRFGIAHADTHDKYVSVSDYVLLCDQILRTSAAMMTFEEAAQRRREYPEATGRSKPTTNTTTAPPSITDDVSVVADEDESHVDDSDVDRRGRMGPVGSLVEHLKEQLSAASRTIIRQVITARFLFCLCSV